MLMLYPSQEKNLTDIITLQKLRLFFIFCFQTFLHRNKGEKTLFRLGFQINITSPSCLTNQINDMKRTCEAKEDPCAMFSYLLLHPIALLQTRLCCRCFSFTSFGGQSSGLRHVIAL